MTLESVMFTVRCVEKWTRTSTVVAACFTGSQHSDFSQTVDKSLPFSYNIQLLAQKYWLELVL